MAPTLDDLIQIVREDKTNPRSPEGIAYVMRDIQGLIATKKNVMKGYPEGCPAYTDLESDVQELEGELTTLRAALFYNKPVIYS